MATVLDVARQAGVSAATVSRVLNGRLAAGSPTRERVLAAMQALEYQPNRLAQGLRRGRGNTVALVVGDIEQNIYSALTKHVQAELDGIGLDLMLYNLDHDPGRLRSVLEMAPAMGLRGVALATTDKLRRAEVLRMLRGLQQRGIVVLSVGQRLDRAGIPSVVHEEKAACQRAVAWLLAAGRAPVAYVGRIAASAIGTERYRGYAAALAQAGLPVRAELVQDVSYRYAAGYGGMQRLLDAGMRCGAVQAGSDEIALGIMAALGDRGLAVPRDIAVVGFGNIGWGEHVRPALTSISVDHAAVGRALCDVLRAEVAGPPPALVVVKRHLVRRGSA